MLRSSVLCLLFVAASAYGLSDPTKPASYHAESVVDKSLVLESVLISSQRKVAVINGAVVAEGDNVGSAKIIKIDKNGVKMNSGGKTLYLKLNNASIRQEK
jgi:MSHA biogenesis protein MshK